MKCMAHGKITNKWGMLGPHVEIGACRGQPNYNMENHPVGREQMTGYNLELGESMLTQWHLFLQGWLKEEQKVLEF